MSELDLVRQIAALQARLDRLESAGPPYTTSAIGGITPRVITYSRGVLASGDTAPNLTGRNYWVYPAGGALVTMNPVDGEEGQFVIIVNLSVNAVTIGRGNAVLNGSANQVLNQYYAIALLYVGATTYWHQVGPLSANG